ncbi:hypothetical protein ElyMa_003541800 [Elysia marginata]|uniref:MAM domain-containing protein n=1 Tax=Elysia marginata TaxID=1093978 RepID=A0AAV4EJC8_9GAST|nr:hypothetical protein ElyMa_003541800 [Elysia marginata]
MNDGSVAIDDVEILFEKCETIPDNAVSVASVLAEASCSFDRGNMCGWKNAPVDASAPKWESLKYVPSSFMKQHADYSADDWYLSVSPHSNKDPEAILESPSLPPTDGVECLSFW